MEFFGTLITLVTSWFGGGAVEAPAQPVAVVVEEQQMEEVGSGSDSMADLGVIEETMIKDEPDIIAAESPAEQAESEPVAEVDDMGMTGNVKPVVSNPDPEPAVLTPDIRTVLVAGGCFWCVEADMEKTAGVISAVSGYAGGTTENPTYQDYGSGGHREVVEVTYDANQVSYEDILIVTMKTTDPTDDDGTFKDRGDKYSSAFYYETPEQLAIINNLIAEVDEFGPYEKPLAIDVEERPKFWAAEDFHQDYYKGLLTQVKYNAYRRASGRTALIERYWGVNDHSPELPWRTTNNDQSNSQTETNLVTNNQTYMWTNYVKPSKEILEQTMDPLAFKVTQKDGTERAGTSPLDKNWEDGIYVDILSGEPLYSSKDKFDSSTGWPSFVKPITPDALTEHEDRKLFSVRTETRSAIADNHIGHVFTDGPADRGGLRYCMNGAALRFVPADQMEAEGYGDFLQYI